MKTIAYTTRDPRAIAWWHAHQKRYEAAVHRLAEFGAAVTSLIGPCAHGNDRHDIVYSTSHRDEVSIEGVLAEEHDLLKPPAGMRIVNGVLKGDPGTSLGLKFIDLAEQHSTARLLDGLDVIGVPSSFSVDGGVLLPGFGYDPQSGSLFQYWSKRGDVKKHVKQAIDRSGIVWRKASSEELEAAKSRGGSR